MRIHFFRPLALLAFPALMAVTQCSAAAIFSAPPDLSGGTDMNGNLVADRFTLSGTATVTQIRFWALQDNLASYTGSIFWSINASSGGLPGASIVSGTVSATASSTGLSAFGLNEFLYTFATNTSLAAGNYFLTLHNGPTSTIPTSNMFWENSNANSGNSQTQDLSLPAQPFVANFTSLAFDLSGTSVPEPGSVVLMTTGLFGALLLRRRK